MQHFALPQWEMVHNYCINREGNVTFCITREGNVTFYITTEENDTLHIMTEENAAICTITERVVRLIMKGASYSFVHRQIENC